MNITFTESGAANPDVKVWDTQVDGRSVGELGCVPAWDIPYILCVDGQYVPFNAVDHDHAQERVAQHLNGMAQLA